MDFIRKKDKKKGWYIYYWSFDSKRAMDLALDFKKKRLKLLNSRLGREEESDYLLKNDIDGVAKALQFVFTFYENLDDTRQRALCNMCFQLGLDGLERFKKMLAAIEKEDWEEARTQALDSLWAKQTPERAARVATMILKGEDCV